MRRHGILAPLAGLCMLLVSCAGNVDPDDGGIGVSAGLPGGGSQETVNSVYVRKMVAMQFTSAGCVNCPDLAEALKSVQGSRPGSIIPVAFHMDYEIDDPMSLPVCSQFYERVSHNGSTIVSLPMFALNFRRSSQRIVSEAPKILSEMDLQAKEHPVCSGVAIQTAYDEASRELAVTARFISEVSQVCRYHILLVEDGIEYVQMGSETTDYVHNNVFRYVASDDMRGARLNSGKPLTVGQEYEVTKKIVLDESWNHDSMRVVAVLLTADDAEGQTFGCNNANECAVGESADYAYKDEK